MQETIVFLVCVQCRHRESSRSLSHLLMSFLYAQLAGAMEERRSATIALTEYRYITLV